MEFVNRELDGERALLHTVLEQMPAGLIVAAPSGKLLLVNPQMEAILGRRYPRTIAWNTMPCSWAAMATAVLLPGRIIPWLVVLPGESGFTKRS